MSDLIRIDVTGKSSETWSRIFESLSATIGRAVESIAGAIPDDAKREAVNLTRELAEATRGWAKAKLEKPVLDNELKIAEIAQRLEEIKLAQVKREIVEVELDEKRLELWEKRLAMAMKWLSFMNRSVTRDENGNMTLVMTNRDLRLLIGEVGALQRGAE